MVVSTDRRSVNDMINAVKLKLYVGKNVIGALT